MTTTSTPSKEKKPHEFLFDPPAAMIVSVIESLLFEEIVSTVDLVMQSNDDLWDLWRRHIKTSLRCPDMDNRRYSHESLKWVLKRGIAIKNFTTRELKQGRTELLYACDNDEAWIVRACIAFNDKKDMNAPDDDFRRTPLHLACMHAHVDVVELLLESGAQPSLYHEDHVGGIPIDLAIRYGYGFDTVKLLLSYHEKDKKRALENLG